MKHFIALIGAMLLGGAAMAQDFVAPGYTLESYGVYCGPENSAVKQAAPGTVLGYIELTDADTTATVKTTRVPASLGISFGVAVQLTPELGDHSAEFRVTHPTGKPGERITERWTSQFSSAEPALNRFAFDFPEELNPGLWVMEVAHEGQVVLRQSFDVVAPEAAADILSFCSKTSPVS